MKEDLEKIVKSIDANRFKNKSVLLIGSNGFLGRWFYDYFKHLDTEILCLDNDIAASDKLNNNYQKCDISKELPINRRYDFVINCAGIASPEKYQKYPIETLDVSYKGTRNVLEYAKKYNVESTLLFSSSEVYGTPNKHAIPTKEDYIGTIPSMSSRSCYDIGKQVLETLAYVYYTKFNMPIKIVRPFNLYGPYMGVKDNRVLSNFMNNYLDGIPNKIYGDGKQTRTFCYVADGISSALSVLLDGNSGEVYNIGNPTPEISMTELVKIFYKALGSECNSEMVPYPDDYPSDEPTRRCPSIDKVVKLSNNQPSVSLEDGIQKMYKYFKQVRS